MRPLPRPAEATPAWSIRELSAAETAALKPSPDSKVHIANNGIFNDVGDAAKNAIQNGTATTGPQYFIYFPKAENAVSELMIAGYQKYMEGSTLGLTNATQANIDAMQTYGQSGLQLDGHSRGSMTIGNALSDVAKQSAWAGTLPELRVNLFGPAANVTTVDQDLSTLQGRKDLSEAVFPNPVLQYQNHLADPVGLYIGGNLPTGGKLPSNSSFLSEIVRAGTGKPNSSHNCYGAGARECAKLWGDSVDSKPGFSGVNQKP